MYLRYTNHKHCLIDVDHLSFTFLVSRQHDIYGNIALECSEVDEEPFCVCPLDFIVFLLIQSSVIISPQLL